MSGWAAVAPRRDVLAGLTVWAVLVPESLAYATIAGVPPVLGLYAAVPSLLAYALLGSSRHLVVAPMSATAALSAGTVGLLAGDGPTRVVALTTALALVVGVLALAAGLLRLGFLSAFISEPVLKGFTVGLSLTIIAGQLPAILGVEKGGAAFVERVWHLLAHLGAVQPLTALVGGSSLVVVLVLRRWLPLVPGSLVAVLLGIGAVALFGLDGRGVAIVGQIDAGLPALGLPHVAPRDYLDLTGPAAGIALVGFVEGLAAAKTYATRQGYDVEPSTELIALGAANLATGLASGMVVNGSLSKTAVNGGAGARSQLSGVAAVLTLLTLLFLTGLFERLPEATLAAVVIAAVVELVDFSSLRRFHAVWTRRLGRIHHRAARADFVGAVAALIAVLLLDTLPGLAVGVAVSLVLLLQRASRPHVALLARDAAGVWVDAGANPDAVPERGVAVVRVESALFFANADHVRERVLAETTDEIHAVVIAGETIATVDLTAAVMLDELARRLRERGVALLLAQAIGQVRDVLDRTAASELPSYRTLNEAVQAAHTRGG